MCSLHKQFPSFDKITVAFFGSIGTELKELAEKKETAIKLAKELKADKTKFEAYAKKYSDDKKKKKMGGDLGFFEKQRGNHSSRCFYCL